MASSRPISSLVSEDEVSKALDQALSDALQRWQLATGRRLRCWIRGYCAGFVSTLAKFLGGPATLGSVLGDDGIVHHVVVTLGDLAIDARGVHTKESLLAKINREAESHNYSLRAVNVIPFELGHACFLKEYPESDLKELRASLSTPAMRHIRRRIGVVAPDRIRGRPKGQSPCVVGGENSPSDGAQV